MVYYFKIKITSPFLSTGMDHKTKLHKMDAFYLLLRSFMAPKLQQAHINLVHIEFLISFLSPRSEQLELNVIFLLSGHLKIYHNSFLSLSYQWVCFHYCCSFMRTREMMQDELVRKFKGNNSNDSQLKSVLQKFPPFKEGLLKKTQSNVLAKSKLYWRNTMACKVLFSERQPNLLPLLIWTFFGLMAC